MEAYARLRSLRENLPNYHSVSEKYVDEYHDVLTTLAKLSAIDLDSFRVASSHVQRAVTSSNYRTGQKTYSESKHCERSFLMMKIDGVLNLFNMLTQKEVKRPIGFNPPGES